METWEAIITIFGLAGITLLTRGFFVLPNREMPIPEWLREGLRYAPIGALVAIVVPEIVMSQGHLIATWKDARLFAVVAGMAWYYWRHGVLGTILAGMAVYLPLHILLGW